jgi:hypothetical protein
MSRSLLSADLMHSHGGGRTRTVWNPNSSLGGAVNVVSTNTGGGAFAFTTSQLASFRIIQQYYSSLMSNKQYSDIPTSFVKYLTLYNTVTTAQKYYKSNTSLYILFQITAEALTGAMNSYGLNTLNVELKVQNIDLQNVIEQLLSKENVKTAYAEVSGGLEMTKTFELAPLFVYYIQLYGVPEMGAGFDPNKLYIVLTALENSGIDPYNS